MANIKHRKQYFRQDQNGKLIWGKVAIEAAMLLAVGGEWGPVSVAAKVGISRDGLNRMRKHPEFIAKIQEIRDGWHNDIMEFGIAQRFERVRSYNDRWGLLKQVMKERQDRWKSDSVAEPGAKTGLLNRRVTTNKSGSVTVSWDIDTQLLDSMLKLEKQVAQELNQWNEGNGKGSGSNNDEGEDSGSTTSKSILSGNPARMSESELRVALSAIVRPVETSADLEVTG